MHFTTSFHLLRILDCKRLHFWITLGQATVGVTIYDIAEKAGVSIATVSRVFNKHPRVSDRTRERVFRVAEDMGYQPHVSARNLAQRKTHLVSAVIPMMTNYFFVEVLRGLQDRLIDSEYDLLVYSAPGIEDVTKQLQRAIQRGQSEGVLLFATPILDEHLKRLQKRKHPVVLVDAFHPELDSISTDNRQGGYSATQHLIEEGCTRIGMIMANPVSVPAADRFRGYREAILDAGLHFDDRYVVVSREHWQHGFSEKAGYEAMVRLLKETPRPDGVFVASDIQALGALRALHDRGIRVPEDVALVGFDDIKFSEYVGLTTLRQPMHEMGRLAVEKLLLRIQEPEHPTSHTVFAPKLIRRDTSRHTSKPTVTNGHAEAEHA